MAALFEKKRISERFVWCINDGNIFNDGYNMIIVKVLGRAFAVSENESLIGKIGVFGYLRKEILE